MPVAGMSVAGKLVVGRLVVAGMQVAGRLVGMTLSGWKLVDRTRGSATGRMAVLNWFGRPELVQVLALGLALVEPLGKRVACTYKKK